MEVKITIEVDGVYLTREIKFEKGDDECITDLEIIYNETKEMVDQLIK